MAETPPPPAIRLRDVTEADLPAFYEHQLDPDAHHRVAFTRTDPDDRPAFDAFWAEIMADDGNILKTILYEGEIAGHLAAFERFSQPEVSYWLGRPYWGKGIATQALSEFLREHRVRPIYGRAASDNVASIRVMEKCGFTLSSHERGFAFARGEEIEEAILVLR